MDLTLPALEFPPANPKGAHSLFPLPMSRKNVFIAILLATPVCQFKFQLVNLTLDTNHITNSVIGTFKDMRFLDERKTAGSPSPQITY